MALTFMASTPRLLRPCYNSPGYPTHGNPTVNPPPQHPLTFGGKPSTIEQNQIAFGLMVHGMAQRPQHPLK